MKISVLIPTYNRADYLNYTLKTCLNQKYKDVEFIIQDDSSTDNTKLIAEKYCNLDDRFKYFNANINVGMRNNFEQSLQNMDGDYVICIGGDDGLMLNSIENLIQLILKFPNKIITWPTAAYFYAGTRDGNSQIVAPNNIFKRNEIKIITSKFFFEKQINQMFYVSDPEVPMLYVKSIVPRSLIEKIKSINQGVFFSSSTPDGYSAFALSSIVENYVFINQPFTMHGVSPSSAGLNYVQGKNNKDDLSTKFFIDNNKVKFSEELGGVSYSPLITLMTVDFLYTSDQKFNHGYSSTINKKKLIKNSLLELCDGLMTEEKIQREVEIIRKISIFIGEEKYFLCQIKKLYRNKRKTLIGDAISSRLIYFDAKKLKVNNIFEATQYLQRYINNNKIYFKFNWIKGIINSILYFIKGKQRKESLSIYLK